MTAIDREAVIPVDEPLFRRRRRRKVWNLNLLVGGALLLMVGLLAGVAVVWTPRDPNAFDIAHRLAPPGAGGHLLGTDALGRDVLSQLMVGGRSTLGVAALAALLSVTIGIALGGIAAVTGGMVESSIMRSVDVMYAFPAVIVAIMMSSALGPGNAVTIIATIAFYAPTSARIIRSASLPLMRAEWFLAARAYGRSRPRIYLRQVLPNIFPTIIVQSTLIFGGAILIAAILAYLGLGEQPPAPSWGRMLFDAQSYLDVAPFLAVWPGMAIVFSVLSANLIGDGLRDIYDVKGSTRS